MSLVMSVDDFVKSMCSSITRLPGYSHSVLEAVGLASERELVASKSLPAEDCAGVLGYAIRAIDTQGATPQAPRVLSIIGESRAGLSVPGVSEGTAVRVGPGSPMPPGADAIIPEEVARVDHTLLRVVKPSSGQFVRHAGDDITRGQVVLRRGQAVGPRHLGLLAALGVDQLVVSPCPRVVIVSVGGRATSGENPEDNSYLLTAAVRSFGALAYRVHLPSDDPIALTEALDDQLVRADLVVTTGGLEDGSTQAVLTREPGVRMYDIAMRPGGWHAFGFLGPDRTPILALPSDAVTAYISFVMFAEPILRRLAGQSPETRPLYRATLTEDIWSVAEQTHYVPGQYFIDTHGAQVKAVGGVGGPLLGALARANSLIVLRRGVEQGNEGDAVPIILLDRDY